MTGQEKGDLSFDRADHMGRFDCSHNWNSGIARIRIIFL
jgi:hypothetical protein